MAPDWYDGEGIYQIEWAEAYAGDDPTNQLEWNRQAYIAPNEDDFTIVLRAFGGDGAGFRHFASGRKIEGSLVDFILDGGPEVNYAKPIYFGMWKYLLELFGVGEDEERQALLRWIEQFAYTDVRLTRYLQDRARSEVHMSTPQMRSLGESAIKALREKYRGADTVEEERRVRHAMARHPAEYRRLYHEHVTLAHVRRD